MTTAPSQQPGTSMTGPYAEAVIVSEGWAYAVLFQASKIAVLLDLSNELDMPGRDRPTRSSAA